MNISDYNHWRLVPEELQLMNRLKVQYNDISDLLKWCQENKATPSESKICDFLYERITEIKEIFSGSTDDILMVCAQYALLKESVAQSLFYRKRLEAGETDIKEIDYYIPGLSIFEKMGMYMKIPWFGVYTGIGVTNASKIIDEVGYSAWSRVPTVESLLLWFTSKLYSPSYFHSAVGDDPSDSKFWDQYGTIVSGMIERKFYGYFDEVFHNDTFGIGKAFLINWYTRVYKGEKLEVYEKLLPVKDETK